MWSGIFCGGFLIPVVLLAINWSKIDSLARHHALIATVMWCVVLAVYVPASFWMVFVSRGPTALFWIIWVVAVTVTLGMSAVNAIRAWRAPVLTG